MKECVKNCREVYKMFWDNPITPISNTTLDKIKEIVYKIVETNFSTLK